MHKLWVAIVAILMSLAPAGEVVAAATQTPLDFNISMNSGAEAGRGGKGGVVPIPLWKTTSTMTAAKLPATARPWAKS